MGTIIKIAVPADAPGGLKANRSGHFGHCDNFTVVSIENDKVGEVEIVANPPHGGNCLAPIGICSDNGAQVIIVHGMGMRPFMGFRQAGIDVLYGAGETVGSCIEAYLQGGLSPFGANQVCGGGGAHGGGGNCGGH